MSQIFVLDAGVLFTTWVQKNPDGSFVTAPGVIEEIQNRPSKLRTEILLLLEKLREETPDPQSLEIVRAAAKDTGDFKVLSAIDLQLIGLAHSKKAQGYNVTIVSTDLAVLNTARHLGLAIIDPSGKFHHEIIWSVKCPACNYRSTTTGKNLECPVCGTEMRRFASKKKKFPR